MSIKKFFEDIYIETVLIILVMIYQLLHGEKDLHYIIGLSLALVSFVLWLKSRYDLGKSFSIKPEAKALVTNGIYSKIRNPMYFFSFFVVLGLIISFNIFYLYFMSLLLFLIQIVRVKKEEKVLEAKFGEQYIDYKNKTWF